MFSYGFLISYYYLSNTDIFSTNASIEVYILSQCNVTNVPIDNQPFNDLRTYPIAMFSNW